MITKQQTTKSQQTKTDTQQHKLRQTIRTNKINHKVIKTQRPHTEKQKNSSNTCKTANKTKSIKIHKNNKHHIKSTKKH